MSVLRPDYQPRTPVDLARRRARTAARWIGTFAVLLVGLPVAVFVGSHLYTSRAYGRVEPGMTRAQVDRQLRAFSARANTTYTSLRPGESMVDYELLGLGKWTRISVIFHGNGTVSDPIPMFDQ